MAGAPGGHRHPDTRIGNSRTSYCTLITTASPEIWVLRLLKGPAEHHPHPTTENPVILEKNPQILELGEVSRVMAACKPSWGPAASPAALPFPYSIKSTPVPLQTALILPKESSRSNTSTIPAVSQIDTESIGSIFF